MDAGRKLTRSPQKPLSLLLADASRPLITRPLSTVPTCKKQSTVEVVSPMRTRQPRPSLGPMIASSAPLLLVAVSLSEHTHTHTALHEFKVSALLIEFECIAELSSPKYTVADIEEEEQEQEEEEKEQEEEEEKGSRPSKRKLGGARTRRFWADDEVDALLEGVRKLIFNSYPLSALCSITIIRL